jgi:beta-glucosidase
VRRILFLLLFSFTAFAQDRVDALLGQMSLEEKLAQLSQFVPDQPQFTPAIEKGLVGSVLNTSDAKQVNELQRKQLANSRLKIPILVGNDVVHGWRTIFPIPLALAATWDPELAELSARIAAREAKTAGIRWTFAPMADIARDPRWGRIAEGAGEDPVLGSAFAAAYVRGFQSEGMLATAKHFAAYGAPEGGRDYGGVDLSEQTLREVYLPPFHAAAQANVASFMSAFNSLNGVPATANRFLLRDILRDEWKFDGFVVSDFAAVAELVNHRVAANDTDAAALAINAGVDMDMWDAAFMKLSAAVKDGRVSEATIDRAVRRVLRAKIAAGLFDDPFTDESRAATVLLAREHRDAARRIARRAIVLLKNDGATLPLARETKIALVGPLADSRTDMLGSWAASGKPEETASVLDGLRAAKANVRHHVGDDIAAAVAIAKDAEVIVAALGESRDLSGEAASRASLDLPGNQQQLLDALVQTGKPVVLLILSGRPMTIDDARVPAVLQSWFLGTEGGHAIADILFGDVVPSGKLPVTIPSSVGQVPIHHAQLPSGRPAHPDNRFTNKYADLPIGPKYPFGFGLSYVTFEYSALTATPNEVSVTVKNAGARAAEEVVQLYLTDVVASVSRPSRELKAFRRIALNAGESRRVTFPIGDEQLRFWSPRGWVVEPGEFRAHIANLEATFTVEGAPRVSSKQQTGFLDRTIAIGDRMYPYTVYVPRNYDPARAWPVILFLHGAGERGTDGVRATAIGLGNSLRFGPDRIPAIVVFPQVPLDQRWLGEPADVAMQALDRTLAEFHTDPKRVYLTGLSMGGYGTWHLALAHPDRFAALAVVCGGITTYEKTSVRQSPLTTHASDPFAFVANALKDKPVWIFHGADDPIIPATESRHMYEALQKAGAGDVHYTEFPNVGHNAWDPAYGTAELWTWMFARSLQ